MWKWDCESSKYALKEPVQLSLVTVVLDQLAIRLYVPIVLSLKSVKSAAVRKTDGLAALGYILRPGISLGARY